ncbi:hypothetical protein P7K49_028193 [Saguinus oedipus]|uniref:Uncharacterized protein n=1 Tax=Saguinus oedipus TaxID=9490 RepID=A0ABQ9UCJ3_SAGOE|nr:hypothetical protein P7K49_028193 [Saguinus oedipus]
MSTKLGKSSLLLTQTSEECDGILTVKMEEEKQTCDLDSILHWSSSPVTFCQQFRQFGYQDSLGLQEALGTLSSLAEAGGAHQRADPGAAGAGAVPGHPFKRTAGLGVEPSSREWRGSCDYAGGYGKTA